MKLKLLLTIICISLSTACGVAKSENSTNSANNSNAKSVVNSNANSTEKVEQKNTDTTPVKMNSDKLSIESGDSLKEYMGRTFILYGQLEKWTTSEMEISMASATIKCSGDFTEYLDAIELYEKKTKRIWVDFRGVLKDVKDEHFDKTLQMENCVITKMDK